MKKIDMQLGRNGLPAFVRLGRVSKVFRGFAPALRLKQADAAYVRRIIQLEELFATGVPLEGECSLARSARSWMASISKDLDVDITSAAVKQSMEVLEFASVGVQDDGLIIQGRTIGASHEDVLHNYCNVHLKGSGWLVVDGVRHRIEAGEAYVFDQALVHEWVQEATGTSRMASFLMEYRVIADWLERARKRPAQREQRKTDRSGNPLR